jgi:hypothetical protein
MIAGTLLALFVAEPVAEAYLGLISRGEDRLSTTTCRRPGAGCTGSAST